MAQQEGLREPLLSQTRPCGQAGISTSDTSEGKALLTPSGFKATRARKTQQFIEDQKAWENTTNEQTTRKFTTAVVDADPRLQDDDKVADLHISMRVASVIYRHYLDGQDEYAGCRKPADDEFHQAHFIERTKYCCCWPLRSKKEETTVESVCKLINELAFALYFCKQVVVLSLVYIERLLQDSQLTQITTGNWRSLVVVGLLLASKVWEDVHPWNADFEMCLQETTGMHWSCDGLYRLESLFLRRVKWKVWVSGETYIAYYFTLRKETDSPRRDDAVPKPRRARSLCGSEAFYSMKTKRFDSIAKDESSFITQSDEVSSRKNSVTSLVSLSKPSNRSNSGTPAVSPREREGARKFTAEVLSFPEPDDILSAKTIHEAWTLDCRNPHIGRFRHAAPALAPSKHIENSIALLWAHKLAAKTTNQMVRPRSAEGSANTISGATGRELANELREYLEKQAAGASGSGLLGELRREDKSGKDSRPSVLDLFGDLPAVAENPKKGSSLDELFSQMSSGREQDVSSRRLNKHFPGGLPALSESPIKGCSSSSLDVLFLELPGGRAQEAKSTVEHFNAAQT